MTFLFKNQMEEFCCHLTDDKIELQQIELHYIIII